MFIKDIYYWQDDGKISGKMMLVMKTQGLSCVSVCTCVCVVVWCVWYIYKDQPEPPLSGAWRSLCPVPCPSSSLPGPTFSLQNALGLDLHSLNTGRT